MFARVRKEQLIQSSSKGRFCLCNSEIFHTRKHCDNNPWRTPRTHRQPGIKNEVNLQIPDSS